jgi:uncharacterized RDD family membrane protein YckC
MNTSPKTFEYSTFLQRVAASLIDTVVLFVISSVIGFVVGFFSYAIFGPDASILIGYLLGLVIGWLFYAAFESSEYMATPGKMALSIQVRDENFQRLSFGRATGRHFARFLSSIPLCIGYLFPLWTQRRQALHDIVAKTVVVNK